jgi:hypothetical protein
MKSSENQIKWITYYNNKKQIHIIPKSGLKLLLNGEKKTPSIPTNMSFFLLIAVILWIGKSLCL